MGLIERYRVYRSFCEGIGFFGGGSGVDGLEEFGEVGGEVEV